MLSRELLKRFVVPPDRKVNLKKDYDPQFQVKMKEEEAEGQLAESVRLLSDFQTKLYAQDQYALLVVFQAMDAAGKDGTIKHVMSGVNPSGCQVYSFKAPTSEELDHDYLWRCFKALPERGRIGIFNRSYYEEVLVVRVHPEFLARQRMPAATKEKNIWRRRYEEINAFERYLVANGIIVLKFFLHVSKGEQKRRFLERIAEPEKHWKFSAADVRERAHWKEYMEAYEDCLRHTSTKEAPWHVIPADNKPFMRLAVANVICRKLASLELRYPKLSEEQKKELLEAKKALEEE